MSKWLIARTEADCRLKVQYPEDETGRPEIGKEVLVHIRSPRNMKHHRKYWGLLQAVVNATGAWHSVDQLHREIKIGIGHYQLHPQPNGTYFAELLPTNVAGMSQREFAPFFERAMAWIAIETGIDPDTLSREAES